MFPNEALAFRWLLAMAGASMAGATLFTFNSPPPPLDLQELYDWRGYGAVIPGMVDQWLWYLWLLLSVTGLVGAFWFWRPAKALLLLPLVMAPVRAGLGGIYVSNPAEDAIWSVYYVFSTFVIGMAFFSAEVRARFDSKRTDER